MQCRLGYFGPALGYRVHPEGQVSAFEELPFLKRGKLRFPKAIGI